MITIFSDASFRNADGVGVVGFLVQDAEQEHFHSSVIAESNNIRCEIRGVLEAMKFMIPRLTRVPVAIEIFTDCQAICKLLERREHLEWNQFKSLRSGSILANADLYQEFFTLHDVVKPTIHWVKGHSIRSTRDSIQEQFSRVDRAVRRQLRLVPPNYFSH